MRTLADVEAFLSRGRDYAKDLSLLRIEKNWTLADVSVFLDLIGHPERDMTVFHVAGSKGKGTVSYALSALLERRFGACGLFLSPFVYDFRERFCRPFSFFSDESYIDCANDLERISRQHESEFNALSVFEKYLVYCVLLFKREKLRYVVFEVGMGGRYDATNALDTDYQLFTTIELEHTDILGDTVEKIACEKSKIIKPNSCCFALNNCESVDDVFRKEAVANNSSIVFLEDMRKSCDILRVDENGSLIRLEDWNGKTFSYSIPLVGDVFVKDSALAVLALNRLGLLEDGEDGRCDSLDALSKLRIPGRFERHNVGGVDYVLDGAHTPESIGSVAETFSSAYRRGNLILVFGCAIDKNVSEIARRLVPHFNSIIVQKPGDYKKSDVNLIYKEFEDQIAAFGSDCKLYKSEGALETFEIINEICQAGSACLVTGSFYLVDLFFKEIIQGRF